MLKNYLKIAVRNLKTNKVFSFINIFGLAMGLTCFMLIAIFVYHELSYDKYPAEAKNIYRVMVSVTGNGDVAVYPNVDVAVGEGIKNVFPEVRATTRILPVSDFIKYGDKQFKEEHLAFADSNFLQMFSIPLVEGNINSALVNPNSIVISASFAPSIDDRACNRRAQHCHPKWTNSLLRRRSRSESTGSSRADAGWGIGVCPSRASLHSAAKPRAKVGGQRANAA
jgi:hypothetical protein